MDPLTASIALSITQLCVSAVMTGTYFAASDERCTRYWAVSGVLMGVGMMMLMLNAGRSVNFLLAAGNISLFAGCVKVWVGLRVFFGREATQWGYFLIALFSLLFSLLLLMNADFTTRAYLSSVSLVLVFVLCLQTLLMPPPRVLGRARGFASYMAVAGLLLLIGMHVLRIAVSLHDPKPFMPATIGHFGTVVLYLVPLCGTLLFFSALLLLYFERIKHNLLLSLAEKQEALETQARFVDMFSHEYRTPLAVIRTNLDILQSKDQSSGNRFGANLTKMRRAVLRLVEVAETALAVEWIVGNDVDLQREAIFAPDFLRTVMDDAAEFWSDRAPELRLGQANAIVFNGDRKLLKTALLNLLDNAIKYGPKDNVVEVMLTATGNVVTLTVNDNGPGIPEQELDLVFGKYYRGSRTSAISGSGMGLYLVWRIIGQHNGSVSMRNRPTGGTSATIILPFHTGEAKSGH
jgi:signal transduction histidine kinase